MSLKPGLGISIHALREEGDRQREDWTTRIELISIHALREEGDAIPSTWTRQQSSISIHALREEGDLCSMQITVGALGISIHALREEGDSKNREKTLCFCLIIHLPAQIAKRCLQTKPQNHTVTCANGWFSGAKCPGKTCVLPIRTGRTSKD